MKIRNIAILMAMEAEAAPLIKALDLKDITPDDHKLLNHYSTPHKGGSIDLITSGKDPDHGCDNVGTVPATLMAYLACEHLQPDIVINAGTAGGFWGNGCEIGDVCLSEGFSFHDRRIPIPGFKEYGIGDYPSFDTSEIAKKLNLKTGRISTGDSLDHTEKDLELMGAHKAIIKDMEAAAIAWLCKTMNVPMFAIKAITDLIDIKKPTPEQFTENLKMASENLCKSVIEVIKTFSDKSS